MAFDVGAITGGIQFDISELTRGLDQAQRKSQTGSIALGNVIASGVTKGLGIVSDTVKRTASGVVGFLKDSVQEAMRFEAAMTGLRSVGEKLGVESNKLTASIDSLTKDGLLNAGEAASALKNLLATGFGLDEATRLINVFKDSAAFGRQASLEFGQAVVTATEGVKNGNSILVDNAGITKNLSVILKEAGFSAQDMANASNDASVRQALLNGLLKEGEIFAGDADKASKSLAGQLAKLNTAMTKVKIELGQALIPVLEKLTPILIDIAGKVQEWFAAHKPQIILAAGQVGLFLIDVVKTMVPFIVTVADRFRLWSIRIKLVINVIASLILQLVGFVTKVGPLVGKIAPELGKTLSDISRDSNFAVAQLKEEFEQLVEDEIATNRRLEENSKNVQKAIELATKDTTAALQDQVDTAQAFIDKQQQLPAGIGAGGMVQFNQTNIINPVTGREGLNDIVRDLDLSNDAGQGGTNGDGETPPPFG